MLEVIPFKCMNWPNQPLFIILGIIDVKYYPTIHGKAYKYNTFPWSKVFKPSLAKCEENGQYNFDTARLKQIILI